MGHVTATVGRYGARHFVSGGFHILLTKNITLFVSNSLQWLSMEIISVFAMLSVVKTVEEMRRHC